MGSQVVNIKPNPLIERRIVRDADSPFHRPLQILISKVVVRGEISIIHDVVRSTTTVVEIIIVIVVVVTIVTVVVTPTSATKEIILVPTVPMIIVVI